MDERGASRASLLQCLQSLITYENDREVSCVLHDAERRPFEPERRTLYLVTQALITQADPPPDLLREIHDRILAAATSAPDVVGGTGFDFFAACADDYLHEMDPQTYAPRGLRDALRLERDTRFRALHAPKGWVHRLRMLLGRREPR